MKRRQEKRDSDSFQSFVDHDGENMVLIEEETSMELKKMLSGKKNARDEKKKKEDDECSRSPVRSDNNDSSNKEGGSDGGKSSDANRDSPSKNSEAAEESDRQKMMAKILKLRQECGRVVNNPYVQLTMIAFISINAIMMGIATYPKIKCDDKLSKAFDHADTIFLIIFSIELIMQMIYHGYRLFYDMWLVFDLVIISLSWALIRVNSGIQVFRAFRIVRAFRLITRIKVMRDLISALTSVFPRMSAIGLMLFLIIYIFGVMFTQLWSKAAPEYFGSLGNTFITLCQMMTMDGWAEITRVVMNNVFPEETCIDGTECNSTDVNIADLNATEAYTINDEMIATRFLARFLSDVAANMTANVTANVTANATANVTANATAAEHCDKYEKIPVRNLYVLVLIICFVIISGFIAMNLIIAVICDGIKALDEKEKARVHGYDDSDDEGSFHIVELREQLDMIEDQLGDLTRIQARTFHTLSYLSGQLRAEKRRRGSNESEISEFSEAKPAPDAKKPEAKKVPRRSGLGAKQESIRSQIGAGTAVQDERPNYRETWTQQGSEKRLRKETVVNFAKAANELSKMREEEKKKKKKPVVLPENVSP